MIWVKLIFDWFTRSRIGRFVGLIAGAVLTLFGIRRSGYRAAQRERAAQDAQAALDRRRRADAAMRRAEGDTRPVDERLNAHGRLRDD